MRALAELGGIVWRASAVGRRVVFIAPRLLERLGYPPDRVPEEPDFWATAVHPEDQAALREALEAGLAGGQGYEIAYRLMARTGEVLPVRETARPAAEAAAGLVGLTLPIHATASTPLDRLEAAALPNGSLWRGAVAVAPLHEAQGRAARLAGAHAQADAEVGGRLAGLVAGDLDGVLATILGYAEMLLMELPAADARRGDVERIREAAERAPAILRPLLAFAGGQRGPARLDVRQAIGGLESALRRVGGAGVDLRLDVAASLPPLVADPSDLECLVLTVVLDAREGASEVDRIFVDVALREVDPPRARSRGALRPGPHISIAVTGTRRGGSPHRLRAGGGPPARALGLARKNGWAIQTYDGPLGRTVKVYLPVTDGLAPASGPPLADWPQGATALVVDDDRTTRSRARRALRAHGLAVLEARDGEEAVALATAHDGPLHVAVIDLVLPLLTGAQVARRAAVLKPGVRILFTSSYPMAAVAYHGWITPQDAFLEKPFAPDRLARRVHSLLAPPRG